MVNRFMPIQTNSLRVLFNNNWDTALTNEEQFANYVPNFQQFMDFKL